MKMSKIIVETNDPDLVVDVNGYSERKAQRAFGAIFVLGLAVLVEAFYLSFLVWYAN